MELLLHSNQFDQVYGCQLYKQVDDDLPTEQINFCVSLLLITTWVVFQVSFYYLICIALIFDGLIFDV
jgi:hypothetical protein